MSNEKNTYKTTLNLPKTDFPMRANLSQNEPQTLKRWKKQDLYTRIIQKNTQKPVYTFHDGPPYANGSIHVGHLLNKVLKDIVVRSKNMFGYQCEFIPGWDCHGLPIEHKVMTELINEKSEKFQALDKQTQTQIIRRECAAYAKKYIKLQSEQMIRLLTCANYEKPYLTMLKQFEQKALEVFASLVAEGIVFRQLKPVHWSIANQTALAEAELEYEDKVDTSIFVNFSGTSQAAFESIFNVSLTTTPSVMIWTTTPWTLPANLAVAIHPDFDYALVDLGHNTITIIAKERIESVRQIIAAHQPNPASWAVLGETKGQNLLGLTYHHPFIERTGRIVSADYVTLEDGTGLVHTAPGHGTEDYQTGLREKLDVYCPVKADGTYDNTVPDWLKGKLIWDANTEIITHLTTSGHLVHSESFTHSYPHDWRSKTPVIFRSTEQWFIGVDLPTKSSKKSLREMALTSIDRDITFHPDWGKNRLRGMLESRPDWCISRQRAWGLPIPAFRMPDGQVFLTEQSVLAVSRCFAEKGSDAWFDSSPEVLLGHYSPENDPDAPKGLVISDLKKMDDIFDVWFESGSSWHAVLQARGFDYPADLYLEGSDQHRGWFHLSLLPALGMTQKAPYRTLLTHGFIVDKHGRKMSKSSGNALNVEDLLKEYGAEVTRWWVSSLPFENDIKVDEDYFKVAADTYRKVRNTLRFLLSNLTGFTPTDHDIDALKNQISAISPYSINAYLVQKTNELVSLTKEAYTAFKFRNVHSLLYNFCNDTLSSLYCMAVKDRLYCDSLESPRRRETVVAMWYCLEQLCRLLAPILPHTAEEAYHSLTHPNTQTNSQANSQTNTSPDSQPNINSIHLQDPFTIALTASPDWESVLKIRDAVLKALETSKADGIENPLDAGVQVPDPTGILTPFSDDLPDLFGVSRVDILSDTTGNVSSSPTHTAANRLNKSNNSNNIRITDLRQEPRCERSWKRDVTVKKRSDGGFLSDRDAIAVGVQ